jgi:hypothetical protein
MTHEKPVKCEVKNESPEATVFRGWQPENGVLDYTFARNLEK